MNRGNGRGLNDEAKRYWAAQKKQSQRYGRRVNWQPTGQATITMGLIAMLVVGTVFASIVPSWSVTVGSLPGGVFWLALLSNAIPGGILGLLFTGVFLWILGNQVEGIYEPWRYLLIYFAAGTLGSLVIALAGVGVIGGSLAVFGLAGAYAMYVAKVGSPRQALQWALILLVVNLVLTGFNVAYMAGMVVAFVIGVGVVRLN